ncbi:MAG: thioredoxin [Actinomycetota bacterium]|nr:thioredoxin [Actinomycetota bacterium]
MESISPHIQDVTEADFQQAVLQKSHEVPVVVDFWAEWCGPCRTLGPALEKLVSAADGAFVLAKVDVDSNQQLAAQFNVQGIPTVIGFRDGAPIDQFTGALPENAIKEWLTNLLPSELDQVVEQARDAAIAGNLETAERLFSVALQEQPDHQEAGTGLAGLMIASGNIDEALIVLGKLAPTDEVERLQSAARLSASRGTDLNEIKTRLEGEAENSKIRIELAMALAARAEYEPALDQLLTVVRAAGPEKDDARKAMLDIFDVLGDGHPLTATYRRQLASALF